MSVKITIVAAFLFLLSGKVFSQQVSVKFEVKGLNEQEAYIGYHFGQQKYLLDTLQVQNDQFELVTSQQKMGIYFIYTPNYFFEFIMDKGSFSLSTTKSGGYQDLEIVNSKENEIFREFQLAMGKLQRAQRNKVDSLKLTKGEDSTLLVEQIRDLNLALNSRREAIIQNNPNSFTASFLRLLEEVEVPSFNEIENRNERELARYNYYQKNYFPSNLLKDTRLLRTPVIQPKVTKYFDNVLIQNPDTLIFHIDKFMAEMGDDPDSFRYWLVTFFKKYVDSKVMGMDAVLIHLLEKYYLTSKVDWISAEYEKKLREEVAYVKPNLIGKQAPPLEVVDSLNQPVYLNQIQSAYTLLFIYDPDCGHCKKAIKKLEELDSRIEKSGIQVYAVCSTTDAERWKKFVRSANPSWIHAIDPTGTSYFRVLYDVRSTPKIFLLDQNKKIIAKKLEVEQFVEIAERR